MSTAHKETIQLRWFMERIHCKHLQNSRCQPSFSRTRIDNIVRESNNIPEIVRVTKEQVVTNYEQSSPARVNTLNPDIWCMFGKLMCSCETLWKWASLHNESHKQTTFLLQFANFRFRWAHLSVSLDDCHRVDLHIDQHLRLAQKLSCEHDNWCGTITHFIILCFGDLNQYLSKEQASDWNISDVVSWCHPCAESACGTPCSLKSSTYNMVFRDSQRLEREHNRAVATDRVALWEAIAFNRLV